MWGLSFKRLFFASVIGAWLLGTDLPQPFCENGKYGYRNASGQTILPARFDYAEAFDPLEKVAWVRLGEKLGLLRMDGAWAAVPRFEGGGFFSQGLAVARSEGRAGYVNAAGAWIIEPRFEGAGPFRDGRAQVRSGNLSGLIDLKGKIVAGPLYLELRRMASPGFMGCSCGSEVVALLDCLSETSKDEEPSGFLFIKKEGSL